MRFIENVINDIYYEYKIEFQLIIDKIGSYSSPKFKVQKNYYKRIGDYNGIKYILIIMEEYISFINLLTSLLESKLDNIILKKSDLVIALLNEKNIYKDIVYEVWADLNKTFKIINIYLSEYNNRVYEYLKDIYLNTKIEVIFYKNNIIIIGDIKDELKEAKFIKEKIDEIYFGTYYLSYGDAYNYNDLKFAYNKLLKSLELAIKYEVKEVILDDKKLVLEEVIESISEQNKNKKVSDFNSKIAKLDNELIKTIEVFFKCGLNLSEAAKELYIHRNTLIYRLDKVQKVTSYDIREFNNAMIFKIIFLYNRKKKII